MSKPVLLLDIDGVINSLLMEPPSMGWPKDVWKKAVYTDLQGNEWPLLWSTTVVEYLSTMHEQGRAEIRWHAAWQEQAVEFAKIVGLPTEWAIAEAPEFTANQGLFRKQQILNHQPAWWKYPAARRILTDEQRPLIWVDDDLYANVNRAHRNGLGQLGKVLMLSPDGQTGMLSKHMRAIEETLLLWEEARGAVSSS